ncbi:hypothetical protein JKP88DRAFT_241429 [Tribonema minus]|uniref:Uncharacterized protein n=1 Tax=Tribonema minus TaxID=303371 RepID=A0A835YXH8_9STRA|nr:hypothetical protein JKP88DRAFT_241429 [Tribonema minus]
MPLVLKPTCCLMHWPGVGGVESTLSAANRQRRTTQPNRQRRTTVIVSSTMFRSVLGDDKRVLPPAFYPLSTAAHPSSPSPGAAALQAPPMSTASSLPSPLTGAVATAPPSGHAATPPSLLQLHDADFRLSPLAGAPPDVCARKLARFRSENFTAGVLGRSLMDLYYWAVDEQAGESDIKLLYAICSQRKTVENNCNSDATQVKAFCAQIVKALRASGARSKIITAAVNNFNTCLQVAQRDDRTAKLRTEACPACRGYKCAVCEYNCAPVPPPILFCSACANEHCGHAIAVDEFFSMMAVS